MNNHTAVQRGLRHNNRTPIIAIEPDFSKFDSAADILRDAAKWGLLEELRELLCGQCQKNSGDSLRIARDIGYELAGAKDRDFAVDLFVHVTGIAEFGLSSLRDYAGKHGCCHEWFRQELEAMRKRLNLPLPPSARLFTAPGNDQPENHSGHAA